MTIGIYILTSLVKLNASLLLFFYNSIAFLKGKSYTTAMCSNSVSKCSVTSQLKLRKSDVMNSIAPNLLDKESKHSDTLPQNRYISLCHKIDQMPSEKQMTAEHWKNARWLPC